MPILSNLGLIPDSDPLPHMSSAATLYPMSRGELAQQHNLEYLVYLWSMKLCTARSLVDMMERRRLWYILRAFGQSTQIGRKLY